MATISIEEFDGYSAEFTADSVPGLDCSYKVFGLYDEGQPFQRATPKDPIGQEGVEAGLEIIRVELYEGVKAGEDSYLVSSFDKAQEADVIKSFLEAINER